MKTIPYESERALHKTLRDTLITREPVRVETNFESIEEVPEDLKNAFGLTDTSQASTWYDAVTGRFVPGAIAAAKVNSKAILVLGAAAAGAGAGLLAGGPIGAGVGAALGGGVGALAAVATQDRMKAQIEIDAKGKRTIKVEPK